MSPAAKILGIISLQARIDKDAAIQSQSGRLGKLNSWLYPDADDHDVRVDLLPSLEENTIAFQGCDLRAQVEAHALPGVGFQNQIG